MVWYPVSSSGNKGQPSWPLLVFCIITGHTRRLVTNYDQERSPMGTTWGQTPAAAHRGQAGVVTDPRTAVTGTRGITGAEPAPTRALEAMAGAFQVPCCPLHLVPGPWAISEVLPRGPQTTGGCLVPFREAVGNPFPQRHGDSAAGLVRRPRRGAAGPRPGCGRGGVAVLLPSTLSQLTHTSQFLLRMTLTKQ